MAYRAEPYNRGMLDVALDRVSAAVLHEVTLAFPKSRHTAIVGRAACGASTLLRVIAGTQRVASGEVRIGARPVTTVSAARRPLLAVTSEPDAPGRWSVRHLLVAAVRRRTLDREDRQHELALAATKWQLDALLDRRLDALSSTERTRANLARIELLKPAIVVADRLLEHASPAALPALADELYRTFRVLGATVISAPSSRIEQGLADAVVVLDGGRVVQQGVPSAVYAQPASAAAALATGDANLIPVAVRGTTAESPIGSWTVEPPPFQGEGIAIARPEAFRLTAAGEENDFIFTIEEASFAAGAWHLTGLVSGGTLIHLTVPGDLRVHKGRVVGVAYDPARMVMMR